MLFEILLFLYCWATIFILLSVIILGLNTLYVYYKFISSPEFHKQAFEFYRNNIREAEA